jgi:cell fate (sporulation/competence/biofilm development) regulator YlbF (YheA/YmcA/DUF963 family)
MTEEKARELGRLIGQTPEYQAVKRANDALGDNKEALEMLRSVEELRHQAQQALARGEEPAEELEARLEELLSKMQVNPAYQQFIVAQENFEKLMFRVNGWIAEGMRKGAASPIITLS